MKKCKHSDLPLFKYEAPIKVLTFPLARRIGKVRHVASVLKSRRTRKLADAYFDKIERDFKNQLLKAGVDPSKIHEQLDTFWTAVQQETNRD